MEKVVKLVDVLEMLNRIDTAVYEGEGYQHEEWVEYAEKMAEERTRTHASDSEEHETHEERTEEPCDGAEVITIKDGTLKMVTGRFVIYDREFLKTHFNTTEAKIYGAKMEVEE